MAKYTTELNKIATVNNGNLETFFDDLLSSYPIFDENYRDTLNMKIVKHYYFHEIGFETPERFVFEINRKMDEIMVYYNQLYKSQIEINPLINYKKVATILETGDEKEVESINMNGTQNENETLETTGTRNDNITGENISNRTREQSNIGSQNTTNNSEVTNTGKIKDVKSDTPSNQLLSGDIENNVYASEVAVNDSDTNSIQNTTQEVSENRVDNTNENDTSTQTQNTTSELTSDTTKSNEKTSTNEQMKDNKKELNRNQYINDQGITISESELLMKYRETFINIDMQVIGDLKTMFMMIL